MVKNETTFVEKQNFNNDWAFKLLKDTQVDSTYFQNNLQYIDWDKVQLPHTPRIEPEIVND